MTDILDHSAAHIRSEYRSGDLTPVDILDATLDRIASRNRCINAIAYLDEEGARAAAVASADRWAAGRPRGDLDGIPVTIKDSINAIGMPWRHGSAAHVEVPDSLVDAPPTARLKDAGAVILGKTTMPDFGMLAAGVSSLYGVVRNPWDRNRNTGGSSAGAGAALAAGIGFAAVGTDIAGSVRLPAAHCGVVALKPTQGRVPHLPASTMRSAGPMARTVDEVIDLYRIISRPDTRDCWSLAPEVVDELANDLDPAGMRIGVLTDLGPGIRADPRVVAAVRDAAEVFADGGAAVTEIAALFDADPYPALDRVFQVRARAEWEALPPARRRLVLPAVADWAAGASAISATGYARDLAAVDVAQSHVRERLADYDLVISPVIPVLGFGAEECGVDPQRPLGHCGFTAWFNQTGQPAATLCFGFADGCPVGVQIVGGRFADQLVLRATRWLEDRRRFPMRRPTFDEVIEGSSQC